MTSSPDNSSSSSPVLRLDNETSNPPPARTVKHRLSSDIKGFGFKPFSRRNRKQTHISLQEWNQPGIRLGPYHDYVRRLVAAGWDNLLDLDDYMTAAPKQQGGLVVSVLDISDDFQQKQWPDLNSTHELRKFLKGQNRDGAKVRLYAAEYQGIPDASVIEAFGNALNLDPRFFLWTIHSKSHAFTPSQRHRAPFFALGFGVLAAATRSRTDAERFKVFVYVQNDETGDGWTGNCNTLMTYFIY